MSVVNLTVKYKPLTIGFFVRDGSIVEIAKAANLNCFLWGGIRNPIIPIGGKSKLANYLIRLFSLDSICEVGDTEDIKNTSNKLSYLKDPFREDEPFSKSSKQRDKYVLGCLDSLSIVEYLWEEEFKHKPKSYKSNCVLLEWKDNDPLANLFSICFGQYSCDFDLVEDFKSAFHKGLKGKGLKISHSNPLEEKIYSSVWPLRLTLENITEYNMPFQRSGLFIGDMHNFEDLCYFWNLRACGIQIEFLPINYPDIFQRYIESHLQNINVTSKGNGPGDDFFDVYYSSVSKDDIKFHLGKFNFKKSFGYHPCSVEMWNGLNKSSI